MPAPKLSFEFFPPKNEKLEQDLWACIRRLEPLGPRFVSVTYGAGGSTRSRTHDTVARLARETSLTPAAHLTCVGATREEVDEVARDVLWGKVSLECARTAYGTIVTGTPEEPVVDSEASDWLREQMRAERPDEPFFDRGPGYARLSGGADAAKVDWL